MRPTLDIVTALYGTPWEVSIPSHLVPLPLCEGPKLEPFTQNFEDLNFEAIDVIKEIQEHYHSVVIKARIDGKVYAVKFFMNDRIGYDPVQYPDLTEDEITLAKIQSHPFNRECRAFGRLKEVNMEHLAVKTHGYVLVNFTERAEKMFKPIYPLLPEGRDLGDDMNMCELFVRHQADNKRPIMGIVKDWVAELPPRPTCIFTPADKWLAYEISEASHNAKILQDVHQLHKHGIAVRDIHCGQFISGVLVDLSMAWTVPHVLAQGDRFRPDWSFASYAARDLESVQSMVDGGNKMVKSLAALTRKEGGQVPRIRPSRVRAYRYRGTRAGLRARPHRDRKLRPLLFALGPFDSDDPFSNKGIRPWMDGPKYDPAKFAWRDVAGGEGKKKKKKEEEEETKTKKKQKQMTQEGKTKGSERKHKHRAKRSG